jgi:hypothetical protein
MDTVSFKIHKLIEMFNIFLYFYFEYRINHEKVPDNEFTIKGLQDGKEYEFRVAAVNKAGPGDWAETSEAIEARPADCMYRFFFVFF